MTEPTTPTVREQLTDLANKSEAFHHALRGTLATINHAASRHWPEAPCFTVEWHGRDEVPPAGRLWASDGEAVWLIWSDGKPIPREAVAVRFWTQALIPAPPRGAAA